MSAAHTPGPWRILEAEADKTRSLEFGVYGRAGGDLVCSIYAGPVDETEYNSRAKANARLIAAAPTMRAALLELHDAAMVLHSRSTEDMAEKLRRADRFADAMDAARAALAKVSS